MTRNPEFDRVTTVMKNCSTQLRLAHVGLAHANAPVVPLSKIRGVADALDSLVTEITVVFEQAEQARRTAGGLSAKLGRVEEVDNS